MFLRFPTDRQWEGEREWGVVEMEYFYLTSPAVAYFLYITVGLLESGGRTTMSPASRSSKGRPIHNNHCPGTRGRHRLT